MREMKLDQEISSKPEKTTNKYTCSRPIIIFHVICYCLTNSEETIKTQQRYEKRSPITQ